MDEDGYNDAPREPASDQLELESERQRRHSLTTQSDPTPYLSSGTSTSNTVYTQPGSSAPLASSFPPPPTRPVPAPPITEHEQRRPSWTALPPIEDYSLRLPPILVPESSKALLPTPPEHSHAVFSTGSGSASYARQAPSYNHAGPSEPQVSSKRTESSSQQWRSYQRDHSHTPTASTSSSYSANSQSGFSERSAVSLSSGPSDGKRDNPMSISSLLNDQLRLPVDTEDDHPRRHHQQHVQEEPMMDVDKPEHAEEINDEAMANFTPFSSEQTIRPASSRKHSPPSTTATRDVDIRSRTPHYNDYAPSRDEGTSRKAKKDSSRWTRKKTVDPDSE